MAPFAVNWQIKESPVGAGSEVRTDLKKTPQPHPPDWLPRLFADRNAFGGGPSVRSVRSGAEVSGRGPAGGRSDGDHRVCARTGEFGDYEARVYKPARFAAAEKTGE